MADYSQWALPKESQTSNQSSVDYSQWSMPKEMAMQQPSFADKWTRSQSLIPVNPARIFQNILAGASEFSQGLHNAPYYLQRTQENIGLAPKGTAESLMPQPTNVNMNDVYGISNPGVMDKLLQGAVQYSPYALTAGLAGLGPISGGAFSGGIGGATQSEQPISGALEGAGLGAAAGAIPAAFGAAKSVISSLLGKPQELAAISKQIPSLREDVSGISNIAEKQKNILLDELSGGTKDEPSTMTDNRKEVLKTIKNNYENAHKEGSAAYDEHFSDNNFGDKNIYEDHQNAFDAYNKADRQAKLLQAKGESPSQDIFDAMNYYLDKYKGIEPPNELSLKDAIKQKNMINSHIGSYYWGNKLQPLNADELNSLSQLKNQYSLLNNEIQNFYSKYPDKADEYAYIQGNWGDNVIPYKEDPLIQKIISGAKDDTSSLASLFKNPTQSDRKIINWLGDEGKDRVLYDVLGKQSTRKTPEALYNTIMGLDEKGLRGTISEDSGDIINQFKDIMSEKSLKENILSDAIQKKQTLEEAMKGNKMSQLLTSSYKMSLPIILGALGYKGYQHLF